MFMLVKHYYGIINLKPGSELLWVIIVWGEVAPHTRATDARLVAACVWGEGCEIVCVRLHRSQSQGV